MERNSDRPDHPLRERRKELQLRQADVAERANCAISYVSMVESGYLPPLKMRERLADAVAASVGGLW